MNAGLKLSKKSNLWLDVGIFSSHIGLESAIGKDCRNLTRSIMAENSPYFESGAKLSCASPNDHWTFSGMVLNGWQRIKRVEGNSLPSFGTQIQFKPNNKVLFNSSTFVGTEKPDTARQMRYFHDFYGIYQLSDRWELTTGFDIGWEQSRVESSDYNTWYSAMLILRYAANTKCALALRTELYHDENAVIINTPTLNGFKVMGISLNFDYAVSTNAVWRIEGRLLNSQEGIFVKGNSRYITGTNAALTTSVAVSF